MRAIPKPACLILLMLTVLLPCVTVEAKPAINLSLYKNYGYGLGDDMSGVWTINTETSDDVTYVEFYIDDTLQHVDSSVPYSWQFNTSNYTIGKHTITAIAYDSSSQTEMVSIQRNFVQDHTDTVIIIVVISAIISLIIATVFALYKIRKNKK